MSVICTWEQRDEAAAMVPCGVEKYPNEHGGRDMCGTWCGTCGTKRYCWRCTHILFAVKKFDDEQFELRKKADSK